MKIHRANTVLMQYGLPSTVDLLGVSYTKTQWRSMYVQAVDKYSADKILVEAAEKTFIEMYKYAGVFHWPGPIGLV